MAANQGKTVDKAAEAKPKEAAIKLDAAKTYTLIGTGKNAHLPKGAAFEVVGADAELIINAGKATLKA